MRSLKTGEPARGDWGRRLPSLASAALRKVVASARSAPAAAVAGLGRARARLTDWDDLLPVALIVTGGLLLRALTIDTRSMWLDETITVKQASVQMPQLLIERITHGVHPPLFHVSIHYWMDLFGTSEIALRGFAALFGIATIAAAYYAGKSIYDRRAGLLAAALLAVSPYHIWYSQEARMYSMMMFFAFLSVGFLWKAVDGGGRRAWLGYLAFTFLGASTQYLFMFLLLGEVVFVAHYYLFGSGRRAHLNGEKLTRPATQTPDRRRNWRSAGLIIGGMLGAIVLFTALIKLGNLGRVLVLIAGQPLGYGHPQPTFALRFNDIMKVLVELSLGFHSPATMDGLVAAWPALLYLSLVIMPLIRQPSERTWLLALTGAGTPLMLFLGLWQGQILASRYFMAVVAPLVVLIARLLSRLTGRSLAALMSILVLIMIGTWLDQSFNPLNVMVYDNRTAINTVVEDHQPGDVVVYEPFYMDPVITYYLPPGVPSFAFPQYGKYGRLRNTPREITTDIGRLARPGRRIWLLLSYQSIPQMRKDTANTWAGLHDKGFKTTRQLKLNNVSLLLFEQVLKDPQKGPKKPQPGTF